MQKVALVNITTGTEKSRLREMTDRAWFSHLLQHPARKQSGFILSASELTRGRLSTRQSKNCLPHS